MQASGVICPWQQLWQAACSFFSSPWAWGDIANVYSQYIQREAAIETAIENGEMQIWLQPYVADTKYSGAYLLADIYEDCWSWPNYDLADYYGINEVYALPSEVWQHGE